MKTTTPKIKKDGWTYWHKVYATWRVACCDCGLVHEYQFRNRKRHIQWRGRRDEVLTKEERRKHRR